MQKDCQHFVQSLLQKQVSKRLGYVHDVEDIKRHRWFNKVHWDKVLNKESPRPFRSRMFGNEMATFSPQTEAMSPLVDSFAPTVDGRFDGFTFIGDEHGFLEKDSKPKETVDGLIGFTFTNTDDVIDVSNAVRRQEK